MYLVTISSNMSIRAGWGGMRRAVVSSHRLWVHGSHSLGATYVEAVEWFLEGKGSPRLGMPRKLPAASVGDSFTFKNLIDGFKCFVDIPTLQLPF